MLPDGMTVVFICLILFVGVILCAWTIRHVWDVQEVMKQQLKYKADESFVRSYVQEALKTSGR